MSLATLIRLELQRLGWGGFLAAGAWGALGPRATRWAPDTHQALLYGLGCVAALVVLAARLRASTQSRALDGWLASLPLAPRWVFVARAAAVALAAACLTAGALLAGQPLGPTLALVVLAWGAALWLAPWRALAAPLLMAGALGTTELAQHLPPATALAAAAGTGGVLALAALARASLRDPTQGLLQGLVHPATSRAFTRHAWTLAVLLGIGLGVRQLAPASAEPSFVGAQVTLLDSGVSLSAPVTGLSEARALLPDLQRVPPAVAVLLGSEAPPPEAYRLVPAATPPGPGVLRLDAGVSPARQLAEQTARRLLDARLGELGPLDSRVALREGLVRYVTWRATDGDPLPARTYAAVAHARRPFALGELFDLGRLDGTRGAQVAGTLGEAWIAALVEDQGDAVIPKLLEAARPGVNWPTVLSRLRIDIDALEQRVLQTIEAVTGEPRAQADLPRLFALDDQAEHPELQLVAVPDRAVPPGWEVVCRARFPGEPIVDALPLGATHSGSHHFHVPGAPMWGERPAVQVGLRALRSGVYPETIWEEWAFSPGYDFR